MKSETKNIACKLTSAELQARKASVIAELKRAVIEKTETTNGARYKFDGSDTMLDAIINFIKTERQCCSFFDFNVAVDATGFIWLELSGPEGTKSFIEDEIGL